MDKDIRVIRKIDLISSKVDIRDVNVIKLIEEWLGVDYKTFVGLINYLDNNDRVITMFNGDFSLGTFNYFDKNQDVVEVELFGDSVNGNIDRGFVLTSADSAREYTLAHDKDNIYLRGRTLGLEGTTLKRHR